MTAVLLQSMLILSFVFGGGLWLGGTLSKWTERPMPSPVPTYDLTEEDPQPQVWHGFDVAPEPVPMPVAVAAFPAQPSPPELPPPPAPVVEAAIPAPQPQFRVVAEAPPKMWEMLYPSNQFGRISETRPPSV